MRLKSNIEAVLLAIVIFVVALCCLVGQTSLAQTAQHNQNVQNNNSSDKGDRASNWFPDSHSKQKNPSYNIVFAPDRVNSLSIRISPENWQAMQDNMVQLYGEVPDATSNSTHNSSTNVNISGQSFALNELPSSVSGVSANPIWIKADISFNGRIWNNVGLRYKGNSSLSKSWLAGTKKMPFKLDFDEFEDDFPEIKNQRFYGFKQLLLNNNTGDASHMRDAASYAVMRDMGLVTPQTAWYDVYLDYGQGAERLGIYTMIEVLDDTVIKNFYGSDKGNIYEADGVGASLSRDTVTEIMESFDKENNKDSDYSDLAKLFQVLHANYRLTDAERWKEDLETVFDVDSFLKWLATNTVIQNWDTYGAIAHNFYLYNVPETGQISWIGWDYNESMGARAYGGSLSTTLVATADTATPVNTMQTRGLVATAASLDQSTVTDDWPLIRFLMDNPVYFESYKAYVEEVITTAYNPERMAQAYTVWSSMLRPYVLDVVGYEAEVERLRGHGEARAVDVYGFLGSYKTVISEQ